MSKLFSFNMMTLDGFFAGPDGDISWHNVDEEFNEFAIKHTTEAGVLLFGRKTYKLMASYWPTSHALNDDPVVAEIMNSIPKVVFSTSLPAADWSNTRLVRGNIEEEVLDLKKQNAKDLAVFGSADLLAELTRLNLVDEHRIMLNPVVLGQGMPLFKNPEHRLNMKLIAVREFRSGNVLLTYQPGKTNG